MSNLGLIVHVRAMLTLILPTRKVISLCHPYRARPAVCPSSILLADHLQVPILISLTMIMDSAKIGRNISFKKFGMVRVKNYSICIFCNKFV